MSSACQAVLLYSQVGWRHEIEEGEREEEEAGVAADRKRARRLILQFSYITAPPSSPPLSFSLFLSLSLSPSHSLHGTGSSSSSYATPLLLSPRFVSPFKPPDLSTNETGDSGSFTQIGSRG